MIIVARVYASLLSLVFLNKASLGQLSALSLPLLPATCTLMQYVPDSICCSVKFRLNINLSCLLRFIDRCTTAFIPIGRLAREGDANTDFGAVKNAGKLNNA